MSDKSVKWSWWPWILSAAGGSVAGLVLAGLFVWAVGL